MSQCRIDSEHFTCFSLGVLCWLPANEQPTDYIAFMVSEDDVNKLASLARLELDPSFTPVITEHLNSILGYVQRLDAVDTSSAEAMSHVHGATNVLREDEVKGVGSTPPPTPLGDATVQIQEMLPSEALLQNAPDHSGRFIRVPLIVE
jgi:aspartyl-tRNA(Asn)/glutamyl-tRNA(Gln) amidotransferase subunit C